MSDHDVIAEWHFHKAPELARRKRRHGDLGHVGPTPRLRPAAAIVAVAKPEG